MHLKEGEYLVSDILMLAEENIKIPISNKENIVLATKSPYLFKNMDNLEIIPLENETEGPAEKTYEVLDDINEVIRFVVGNRRGWVYEAGYLIEGRGLAQHISDALSAMDVLAPLLGKCHFDEIILYPSTKNIIECMLLTEIAKHCRIQLKIKYTNIYTFLVTKNTGIIYRLKCIRYIVNDLFQYSKIIKRARKNRNSEVGNNEIGLIIVADSKKYINWLKPLAEGMSKKFNRCRVISLCAPMAADYFRQSGIPTDNMENWLVRDTVKKKAKEYRGYVKKIWKSVKKTLKFNVKGYDISKSMFYFISLHLLVDIPRNLKIDSICEDYFKNNNFEALSSFGDSDCTESRAEYFNTREHGTKLFRVEGLKLFAFYRYEPYANIIGIRFMCRGAARYEELVKQGWTGNAYFVGDALYQDKFMKNQSKQ